MTVTEFAGSDETLLAEAMALCNDAEAQEGRSRRRTDGNSLVNYASSLGISQKELQSRMPRVGEAPFDSVRKMMSTNHRNAKGRLIQYTKRCAGRSIKMLYLSLGKRGSPSYNEGRQRTD